MTVLKKTSLEGTVEALLINADSSDLASARVDSAIASYAGFEGDVHAGLTRRSCVRVKGQYTEGTEIRNTRQLSLVSLEELALLAEKMGLDQIIPEWLGANIFISGVPDFSELPPSTRLIFSNGVSIVVDMENGPCRYPGEMIERFHPGKGRLFAPAAIGIRGLTGWIEHTGTIDQGETVNVHMPPQRIYAVL